VPVNRRNALMVLAPQAYMEPIRDLIEELDRPGMQVMIHTIIAEIQHADVTSLGMRIAADPSILSDPRLTDTAIGGSASVEANQLFGGTFAIGDVTFGRTLLQGNLNVAVLIQMMIEDFGMRVLLEPKLYTADNQEAEFFDGQDIPIITENRTSSEGTSTVSNIKYVPIGNRLRIRPHITQEGGVDLNINLEISRTVPGQSVMGNLIFDRRRANEITDPNIDALNRIESELGADITPRNEPAETNFAEPLHGDEFTEPQEMPLQPPPVEPPPRPQHQPAPLDGPGQQPLEATGETEPTEAM